MKQYRTGNSGSATMGNISKGERQVREALCSLGVKYFRETKFIDCRGGEKDLPLPFDFSVVFNDKIVALIEFQGIQHTLPTFGTEDWIKIQNTDNIKRQYCKEKGIPLLEIQYHQYTKVATIVKEFLQKTGVLKKYRQLAQQEQAINSAAQKLRSKRKSS